MKTKIKDLFPALALSIISSFMLFIFEPITMYANNMDDFWFDFYILIKPTLIFFLLSSLSLSIFFLAIYLISTHYKKKGLYNFVLYLAFFCFICAYIHSNFLTNFLPPLDGSTLEWNNQAANISSITVCIVLIIIIIFCKIKIGDQKTIKYATYLSFTVFAMLSLSLSTTCLTTPVFEPKKVLTAATDENLGTYSSNQNFLVLLIDAVDSATFNEIVMDNDNYAASLKDFTYFPDTLAGYAFTRDSIPFIFSGVWNENQQTFDKYSTEAFNDSAFFNALSQKNYRKNFYDYDFVWRDEKALEFENIVSLKKNIKSYSLLTQEIRYLLFKILPFPLKRFSRIDTLDFNVSQADNETNSFLWANTTFYHKYLNRPVSIVEDKIFQYIHLEGGHVPFDTDKDVNLLPEENGTYPEKLEATMKVISAYLSRLKENNVYDNSTIVILADHGFRYANTDRQNPILYIKGSEEHHSEIHSSEKQISYADMCSAFIELLNGASSTEIFSELPTDGRTRRYIYYRFGAEKHMLEYEQTGKAWNDATLTFTGREFNL